MNGPDRLERELTTWFADTAAPRVPDYTADILGATAAIRQRPRWSFPARWLPAAVVPRLPRLAVGPVPWRTIALLAAVVLLLAAAVALYVGSPPRLPAPFGPAVNGLVAYAEDGEIWTVDPVTGVRQAIITLPGADIAPRWSRDGTRLAFLRPADSGQSLAITNANGTHIVVSDDPAFVEADTDSISWSPDDRYVAVVGKRGLLRTTHLVDSTTGKVRDLKTPNVDTEVYWRPADGRQLMYIRRTAAGLLPFLLSVDDGSRDPMAVEDPEVSVRPGGWTPDGMYFVVHRHDHNTDRAWTELLDPETGTTSRHEVAFGRVSNDGTQIVGHGMFGGVEALCNVPVSGGTCVQIAEGRYTPDFEHSAGLQWSPDDRWIVSYPQDETIGWVLVDPEGGPVITPVWSERGFETWQRLAP